MSSTDTSITLLPTIILIVLYQDVSEVHSRILALHGADILPDLIATHLLLKRQGSVEDQISASLVLDEHYELTQDLFDCQSLLFQTFIVV